MQRTVLIFLFLVCSIVAHSQNKLDAKIRVLYNLNYLESKKPNSEKIDKIFYPHFFRPQLVVS